MTDGTGRDRLIDCAELSRVIGQGTTERTAALAAEGILPTLAVVHVGDGPAAKSYRAQITKQAGRVGIAVRDVALPSATTPDELDATLTGLNADHTVHGVLVQAPIAADLRPVVLFRLSTDKDPEGVTPRHLGMLFLGVPEVQPPTPAAILTITKHCRPDLRGARVVIVNGSQVIGRPLAMLLIDEGATPMICTVHTRDLAAETQRADVLVVAAGHPRLIGREHVAAGAVVIDAAINRLPDGSLVGDVNTAAVLDRVGAITPVPGGVGPVTTAKLLSNVATLADLHRGIIREYV